MGGRLSSLAAHLQRSKSAIYTTRIVFRIFCISIPLAILYLMVSLPVLPALPRLGRFGLPADNIQEAPSLLPRPGRSGLPADNIQEAPSLIPRKIWQIYFREPAPDPGGADRRELGDTISWLAWNRDYQHVLLGKRSANEFARKHIQRYPSLPEMMAGLQNTGLKSDLLRYLVLMAEGGVYTDIDTEALKPIDDWVPERYRKDTRVVIGVEFDRLDGPDLGFPRDISFCQWTIAAAPGHGLLRSTVDRVVSNIEEFAKEQNASYSEIRIGAGDVLRLTGPNIWTDVVFEHLRRQEPGLTELGYLSGLTEPRLVGDVLILPIDGFAMGVSHSNATSDGSIPDAALVKHKFGGSWRGQVNKEG